MEEQLVISRAVLAGLSLRLYRISSRDRCIGIVLVQRRAKVYVAI